MDSPSQQNLNQLPVGTVLGDFKITGIVGEGGFGIVYLAHEAMLDRTVAIKEYLPSSIAGRTGDHSVQVRSKLNTDAFTSGLRNFLREAQMLAKFSHPALVEVHRVWEQNATAYMAMRFYAGNTLRELYRGSTGLDEGSIRRIIEPIFDAVELLHAQNVIHRDVSPDNILMRANGAPVLLDLGAARLVVGGMTQALTTVLKPGYAPIEQYVDDGTMVQGPWTDVYGLGAVLYFLLAGAAPPQAVARMITDPLPGFVESIKAVCSPTFRSGLVKALAVRPENRFQSVNALREGLGWTKPMDSGPKTEFVKRESPAAVATPVAPPNAEKVVTTPSKASAPVADAADDATVVWTGGKSPMGGTATAAAAAAAAAAASTPASASTASRPADLRANNSTRAAPAKRSFTGLIAGAVVAAIAAGGYFFVARDSTPPVAPPPAATATTSAEPPSTAPAPTDVKAAPTSATQPPTPTSKPVAPDSAVTPPAAAKPEPENAAAAKAKRDAEAKAKALADAEEKAKAKQEAKEKAAKAKAEADERAKAKAQSVTENRPAAVATPSPSASELAETARKAQQEENDRLAAARAQQDAAERAARAAAATKSSSNYAAAPPAPKRIEDLSSQAMAAYRRGESLTARSLWTEIINHSQAGPGDKAHAYNNMAISYCQAGDEANCERMYMATLRADRNYQVGAGERESPTFKRAYDRALRAVRGQ